MAIELKEVPLLSLDMFKPAYLAEATSGPATELFTEFYGKVGFLFCAQVRRGELANGHLAERRERVDNYFFKSIRDIYELPDKKDPSEFYLDQQKHAVQVIDYLKGKILPGLSHRLGLKNEVEVRSESPSKLLTLISFPEDTVTPRVRFEAYRHLMLAHISGMLDSRTRNARLWNELSDAQDLLNAHLYKGIIGESHPVQLLTYHDALTNEALGLREHFKHPPAKSVLKLHNFEAREVEDVGLVYTNPRKKNDVSAILKSLIKAANNGRIIRPTDDVKDSLGMVFVVMGDNSKVDVLGDKTKAILEKHPRGIERIKDDPLEDRSRGQSKELNFRRLLVYVQGIPVPLELMFFSYKDYLNQLYQVGRKDSETEMYDGQAHIMYELRRVRSILPVLYPAEIYGEDIDQAILDRMDQVAKELKSRDRVVA